MKLTICFIFFILFSYFSYSQVTELNLKFTNLEPSIGNIHIGIYNTEVGFPDPEYTFWNKIDKIKSNTYLLKINDLPPGRYCVSVFHDKNANDKFDFNFFGIPLETYGFSKNVYHLFKASTFRECAFYLKDRAEYTINLIK